MWVSGSLWEEIKQTEKERLVLGESPADGQLGILTLSKVPPRLVDLMPNVCGFTNRDDERLKDRAPIFDGIKVIDPILLFRCKCHCFQSLDQSDRQDARHVRMMALILPEYLEALIDVETARESETGQGGLETEDSEEYQPRNILKEIKLVKQITNMGVVKRVIKQLEIEPQNLLPWDRMESCKIPLIEKYARSQRVPRSSCR